MLGLIRQEAGGLRWGIFEFYFEKKIHSSGKVSYINSSLFIPLSSFIL
jgi:hypothetical protein